MIPAVIPYFTIPNAMGSGFADRLLAHAVSRRDAAQAGRIRDMAVPGGRVDTSVRNVLVITDLGELRDELERGVDARLPEAHARLGVGTYVPARKQLSLVAYGDGAFYARHLDTTINPRPGQATRQITFVYYFHREPKGFTGGALRVYGLRTGDIVDLEPVRDTFVVFPSWVSHEVLPVSSDGGFADGRFAVNIWVTGQPTRPR